MTVSAERTMTSVGTDRQAPADGGGEEGHQESVTDGGGSVVPESDPSIPKVRVEPATPLPVNNSPGGKIHHVDDNNNQDDEEEDDDEDEDGDGEEVEEEEEEEEEKEMTPEEKKEMHEAVQLGDIDALEDCLDKPNSDINMLWFRENLLMTAIREGHKEMAEFLLDNGVDHTFQMTVMGVRETSNGKILEQYQVNCRQMAYDREMYDIVELIDILQDNVFPFYKPQPRTPRLRRPKPTTPPGSDTSRTGRGSALGEEGEGSGSSDGSQSDSEGSDDSDQGGLSGIRTKKPYRHRRRRKTIDECDNDEKDKTTGTGSVFGEVDSGHHSLGSSKLKVALVREHDKLSEWEENANPNSNGSAASPRRSNTGGDRSVDHSAKEQQEEEATEVQDEGYGSISMKSATPCLSPDLKPIWTPPEPSNRFRATKATLAARRLNGYRDIDSSSSKSYLDRPLEWKKVSSFGSYANESKNWRPRKQEAPNSSSDTRSSCSHDALSCQVRDLSTSSPPTSASTFGTRDSIVSISSFTSTTSGPSKSAASSSAVSSTKSGSTSVARYMQPTKSTIRKQRLSPNFAPSYGVLEFTHVLRSETGVTDVGVGRESGANRRSQQVPRVSPCTKVLQRRTQQSFSFRR